MKSTTLTMALLVVVATAFASNRNYSNPGLESTNVAVISNAPKLYKLIYTDTTPGKVRITLQNKDGKYFHHSYVVNKSGFSLPFNLEQLPDGDYSFKIHSPDGTSIKKAITIKTESPKPNFAADVMEVSKNKYRLTVIANDKSSKNSIIKLYDQDGLLIHEEKVKNLYGFRKIFDLSKSSGHSFKFAVSNASGVKYLETE